LDDGLFFGAVFFRLPLLVGIAQDAALHPVVNEDLVGMGHQVMRELAAIAHGQQVARRQHLVEHS